MGSVLTMFLTITLSYFLLCLSSSDGMELNARARNPQALLNIFQITTFPNEECTATNGLSGVCLSTSECDGLRGFADGNCAVGFGICCILSSSSCGDTISRNLTYVRNPGYPGKYSTAGDCKWEIAKLSEDICQIRLDFQTMVIADPNVATDPSVGKC